MTEGGGCWLPTAARRSSEHGVSALGGSESEVWESGVAEPSSRRSTTDRLSSPVTEVGVILGTPAYMAPEQHLGADVGPAADQYAFCAALYEGLYGRRPFVEADTVALARAKHLGVVPPGIKGTLFDSE